MSVLMTDTDTDRIDLQPATVVTLKQQKNTAFANLASALTEAGIREYPSMKFRADPDRPERLLGVGLEVEVDGRSQPDARTINEQYGRIIIPNQRLEDVFGLTPDDVQAATDRGDPIRLLVYAGDEILAFEQVDGFDVPRHLVTETQAAGGDD